MTVHLKKVCQGLMAHLLIKNALYILIPSKLLNVSSDPQFEERVVERYGISIHSSTELKWIFYHNRFFFLYYRMQR
jgi:hypothetical protein